ncbi:MAG: D-alanyl-D-alanine carboxypeptidase [Firmicutes bacterium]|nr:D-alanyl-D-alanine carboxypeptidase [Bacillota bacterium]
MKKIVTVLLMLVLFFGFVPEEPVFAADEPSNIIGAGAILIDAATGEVLYEKNAHTQMYPASCTKILTGILAIENLDLSEPAVIDAEASFTEGSRVYLLEGEEITVEEVLYALFLESANDAAICLAKMISGSVEEFAVLMNQKARELGALNSNFVNPNGLPNDDHKTTAYDLAMIAKYAMQNETFRKFCSTYQYTIPATNLQDTRYLYNTNRLLYDTQHKVTVNGEVRPCKYEGITGIKTGYTNAAGNCLVAGAQREGTELIAVTLHSNYENGDPNAAPRSQYADCISMLDWGFAHYKTVQVTMAGESAGTFAVLKGDKEQMSVRMNEAVYATVPVEGGEALVKKEIDLPLEMEAPIAAGQVVGTMTIYVGNDVIGTYDLTSTGSSELVGFAAMVDKVSEKSVKEIVLKIVKIVVLVFVILVALLFIWVLYKRHQIKKRKLRRQMLREQERLARERAERARMQTWTTWDEDFRDSRH